MGKASKRLRRQKEKKRAQELRRGAAGTEQELRACFAAGEYQQVLEKLATLIQAKDVKPEFLYDGAYSYFMLGDLERASQWVSNTLTYAPSHVEARLLLARICLGQQRQDDAFAVLEFLAEHDAADLTEAQRKEIRGIGGYALEAAGAAERYPHLAALLEAEEAAETAAPVEARMVEPAASEATSREEPDVGAPAVEEAPPRPEEPAAMFDDPSEAAPAPKTDALALLRSLKKQVAEDGKR